VTQKHKEQSFAEFKVSLRSFEEHRSCQIKEAQMMTESWKSISGNPESRLRVKEKCFAMDVENWDIKFLNAVHVITGVKFARATPTTQTDVIRRTRNPRATPQSQ
jgi:hypothetical protein